MARNADETRRKILEAATDEFAQYGIAGARVDRITKAAGVNNALLYRYFGSKVDLFDTVYSRLVTEIVSAVPLDPTDLPGPTTGNARLQPHRSSGSSGLS
ncbi:TetR/AcrR family transcriptional regulator, partial [Streptomyces sp. NPDC003857]